jgi:hypothetical protein
MMQREEEEKVSFSGFRTSGRNRRRKKATSVNRPLTLSTFFFLSLPFESERGTT